MTTPAKKSTIGNFLSVPNTKKFLEENLKERRAEFVSNLITLCENDSNLAACDPKKLMMCAMNATALNLPLNRNLGFAYIIPYKDKSGEQIPNFQIGYKGLIQLAVRSGFYEFLNACEIREDEIERNKVTGEIKFLKEKPNNKIVGYLAFLKLKTGFSSSLYMTLDEIEKHALRFSKMYQYDKKNNKKSSKWSDADARPKMALKTVLKGLLGTYGVITTELAKAFENDTEYESNNNNFRDVEEAEVVDQKETKESKKVQI
jgi:recombination protein RecT